MAVLYKFLYGLCTPCNAVYCVWKSVLVPAGIGLIFPGIPCHVSHAHPELPGEGAGSHRLEQAGASRVWSVSGGERRFRDRVCIFLCPCDCCCLLVPFAVLLNCLCLNPRVLYWEGPSERHMVLCCRLRPNHNIQVSSLLCYPEEHF